MPEGSIFKRLWNVASLAGTGHRSSKTEEPKIYTKIRESWKKALTGSYLSSPS
jgi:hypothetical protein